MKEVVKDRKVEVPVIVYKEKVVEKEVFKEVEVEKINGMPVVIEKLPDSIQQSSGDNEKAMEIKV